MLPYYLYLYIGLGVFIVAIACITLIYFWIKAGREKAAQEVKDRMIAALNKERIDRELAQRIAERTADIESEKVEKQTKQDLDKGELSYFDKHPFS
jgi:hypothetical protein